MKKLFLILCILLCFAMIVTSCDEAANTSGTDTTDTTETTETTDTTEASTTEASSDTRDWDAFWASFSEIRETEPIQTEIPELQEKIDRFNKAGPIDYSKVIVEIGDQRDVPYLFIREFVDYLMDPGAPGGRPDILLDNDDILDNAEYFPVYTIAGEEDLRLYCNDVLKEEVSIYVLMESTGDIDPSYDSDLYTSQSKYASLSEAYNDLPKGTYYAFVKATCYGNYIMHAETKEPLHDNGERVVEYCYYDAFFILEFQ